jgi:hypothetical protein
VQHRTASLGSQQTCGQTAETKTNNPEIKNKERVKWGKKRKELRVQDSKNRGKNKQETEWTKERKKEGVRIECRK